jgi:hypothetical protein
MDDGGSPVALRITSSRTGVPSATSLSISFDQWTHLRHQKRQSSLDLDRFQASVRQIVSDQSNDVLSRELLLQCGSKRFGVTIVFTDYVHHPRRKPDG